MSESRWVPTRWALIRKCSTICLFSFLPTRQRVSLPAAAEMMCGWIQLHPSYHGMIDQHKLSQLFFDKALMGQLREAEAITSSYA